MNEKNQIQKPHPLKSEIQRVRHPSGCAPLTAIILLLWFFSFH
jgi:hypothetical protein